MCVLRCTCINQYLELIQLLRGVVAMFCSKYQSWIAVIEKGLLSGTKQLALIKPFRFLIYSLITCNFPVFL